MNPPRIAWAAYGIALAAVAGATALRWLADPWLERGLPLIAHLIVVLVLARAVPLGPTLLAIVAGGAAGGWFFMDGRGGWATGGPDLAQQTDYALYFIVSLAMAAVSEAMRRAERSAAEHEAIFAAAIETALDCIVTIDEAGRIVDFNRSAERTFRLGREQVLGRDLAGLLIPEPMREAHRRGLARLSAGGQSSILGRRVELTALRADGTEFPIELAVTRATLAGRTIFTAFIRDISERHEARAALAQSESRSRELIEQITDYAIFTMDLAGRATSWNEGVRRVLGFEEAEFLGEDVTARIFTHEDIENGVPARELATAARTGAASNDRWMQRRDGTRFFAAGVTISRRDEAGNLVGYAKIMRDQTARKEMENRLRQTATELAEAMEKQSRFLAMLSHELRNPMAALRNAVEVLRLTGKQDGPGRPAVEMVGRQVVHMGHLIDDLLDANRIRSGRIRLHRERMDLGLAVEHAVEVARPQCGAQELEITVDVPREPLWIDADFTRVVQVLGNLLHNACKFTPKGGAILVTARREAAVAEVRVRDTGIGIAADHLEHIFEMFLQVDRSIGRSHGGLGIGLSVVKSLVEMHGGRIEARSTGAGQGTEFIVRLPLAAAAGQAAPARAGPTSVEPQRILVLDDNRDAAESLEMVLKLHGHETFTAHDGEQALEAVQRHAPRIALLDLGLPGMSGYEVARRIRAGPRGRDIILVAVTGWGQDEDRRMTREAGFDAHLTKPIDYGGLAGVLAGLLEGPRATGT